MTIMTLHDIKSAIERLTSAERDALGRWLNIIVRDGAAGVGYRVEESAVAYAADTEHGAISVEEYLQAERDSPLRHEYVSGHVYAMAGTSDDHNRIAGNLFSCLHTALRGKPCEPFIGDMKVKVLLQLASAFYYPDVLVACDPTDTEKYYRQRPTVIAEVLSPHTRRTDEWEKAVAYRLIPTVEVYCLIEQDRLRVTTLHRPDRDWRREVIEGRAGTLKLKCLNVEIPLERLYERTAVALE